MLLLADDVLELTPVIVFAIVGFIFVVSIISRTVTRIVVARARETTRREIAAYIAEGTIHPDHGIELMKAGGSITDPDGTCGKRI